MPDEDFDAIEAAAELAEQEQAAQDSALAIRRYYDALVATGFSNSDALAVTISWNETVIASTLGN